ncbi:MAG: hypothetical protein A2271_01175 [Candidatus Moranbacteria bacterium RIFOXYA12_FULL_35_19]|nr:MAG: hypothetical protein UR78_C0005G0005 [Candidatus Moranbacteria bacterium GW2011_GWF2_35_39]OGI30651.1 MAG: hypothetical protein A2343_03655 [Candidatus Moranbacteria bacterium RIFOXYB12_FULL_35_8]OGI33243.1 MAG: hypothetical protein A2489_01080 [Candidatus Moranbacteria bacterium RIFOXYC12_FULL_36_13]OGI36508.1 MAG: hypothetical protein A2271_01175 [Candidatus Moranbacteria bacterium RIFOXYA12_FULL_35_19]
MNKKIIPVAIIATVLVSIGSFYGGTIYQKKKMAPQNFSRGGNNSDFQKGQKPDGQRMGQNNSGGAFENGEIISKDDKSITIKTRDGGSKIVYFSDSTTIGKTIDGSISDLSVGNQVMVNGKNDSSGVITAQNIQIRPNSPVGQNR